MLKARALHRLVQNGSAPRWQLFHHHIQPRSGRPLAPAQKDRAGSSHEPRPGPDSKEAARRPVPRVPRWLFIWAKARYSWSLQRQLSIWAVIRLNTSQKRWPETTSKCRSCSRRSRFLPGAIDGNQLIEKRIPGSRLVIQLKAVCGNDLIGRTPQTGIYLVNCQLQKAGQILRAPDTRIWD